MITYVPNIDKKCIEQHSKDGKKVILKEFKSHKRAIEVANQLNIAYQAGMKAAMLINKEGEQENGKKDTTK